MVLRLDTDIVGVTRAQTASNSLSSLKPTALSSTICKGQETVHRRNTESKVIDQLSQTIETQSQAEILPIEHKAVSQRIWI